MVVSNMVASLVQEDPLEKAMATHSRILAWRIPWTERSLAGYSPGGRKESDMTEHAMPGSRMICGLLVTACGI